MLYAQKTKKPELLVYGHDMLSFAAAVQGAKSDVPTLWVVDAQDILPELFTQQLSIENLPALDGGIWMELLMEVGLSKQRNDSLAIVIKKDMSPRLVQNAVERILSKQTNLTVVRGERIESLKPVKKGWEVVLTNKHRYQVRAMVDGSNEQQLPTLLSQENTWAKPGRILPISQLEKEQYRTLLASGEAAGDIYGVSLQQVLFSERDGIFSILGVQQLLSDESTGLPIKAAIGQAMGAAASYLAFFKTTSDKIDVRKLQSELLLYGARIVPYQDIAIEDVNFGAVQRLGLSGIFKGSTKDRGFYLGKKKAVTFAEIEPIFRQLYSRSQLWFVDNTDEEMTWANFLDLIRFVGMRGEEIEKQIEKDWSSKLKFEGSFDREAQVSRYQFAAILDRYASAYVKAINQDGQFVQ